MTGPPLLPTGFDHSFSSGPKGQRRHSPDSDYAILANIYWGFTRTSNCSAYLKNINSLNPHKPPLRWLVLLSSPHRLGNPGTERFGSGQMWGQEPQGKTTEPLLLLKEESFKYILFKHRHLMWCLDFGNQMKTGTKEQYVWVQRWGGEQVQLRSAPPRMKCLNSD